MFRQKGTGNARTGGIRNPIKKGGGHAKQKRPKDWRQAIPKKVRRLARNSAILMKMQSSDIRVVDEIKLPEAEDQVDGPGLQGAGDRSELPAGARRRGMRSLERSARNLDRTTLTTVSQLNAWDILKNRTLLMTKAGLEADFGIGERVMDNINIIIKPLVTEKSTHLAGDAERVCVSGGAACEQDRRFAGRSRRSIT